MKRTPIDLAALKVFRNAFAVSSVGPYEQHFIAWSYDVEPAFEELGVRKDPITGKLHIDVDNGMFGGIGAPPNPPKRPPPDVAPLQRELEEELKVRAPNARHWIVEYEGAYRTVTLQEMMPTVPIGTSSRIGWNGSVVLAADATLTHVIASAGSGDYQTGFGIIELSEPERWVDYSLPTGENGAKLLIDSYLDPKLESPEKTALTDAALEAARRLDSNLPGPTIAEIARKQGDSLLPRGIDQKIRVHIAFYARPKAGIPFDRQQQVVVPVELDMTKAAHGPTTGARDGILGGVRFHVEATLTPHTAMPSPSGSGPRKFDGTLHLLITDGRGHTFDRSYPATGDLLVDGDVVALAAGLSIPGSSGPSPEMDALRMTFPGQGDFRMIDMYITAALEWDPREH